MPKLVCVGIEGQPVTNVRFERDSYVLQSDEHVIPALPEAMVPKDTPRNPHFVWQNGAIAYDSTAAQAEATAKAQKIDDIVTNLPNWSQVQSAIQAVSNLQEAKAVLLKLARVVYWLAKDSKN